MQKTNWIDKCVEELKESNWVIPAVKHIQEICQLHYEVYNNPYQVYALYPCNISFSTLGFF